MTSVKPELVELAPQSTLSMRFAVSPTEFEAKLSRAFSAVRKYAEAQGVEITGWPFVRYHAHDEAAHSFDLEAGLPVAAPVAGDGEIAAGTLPGGLAATLLHVGPYQELGASHWALRGWVEREGHHPNGGPWDDYLTNPHEEPDPARWETRIYQPLQD